MNVTKVLDPAFSRNFQFHRRDPTTEYNPDFRIMGEYVTKILKCFGCIEGDEPIGFPSANQSGSVNKDEVVAPYLQVMARFRADIRNGMKGDKSDLAKAVSYYL